MNDVTILLVEDNEGDILLTVEAMSESRINNQIILARDGEEALQKLEPGGLMPDLIILDINLPKVDGLEVLSSIRANDRLKQIPVIIFTTSSNERDITTSFAHKANCFISKPVDLSSFSDVVHSIEEFWAGVVRKKSNERNETN